MVDHIRLSTTDNTKMDFREICYEFTNLNNLAQDRSLWSCLVNTVIKKILVFGDLMPRSPNRSDDFLNNFSLCMFTRFSYYRSIVSFSKSVLHRVQCSACRLNLQYPVLSLTFVRTKCNLLCIRNQSVPRCKHFPPRL